MAIVLQLLIEKTICGADSSQVSISNCFSFENENY